jgi:hypothetical protein
MVVFRGVCFENALRMFDVHVTIALNIQPEKTMSSIDLENPPAKMVTDTGATVLLVGKVSVIEFEYVLHIIDGDHKRIVFSNRDATETRDTYRQSLDITIKRVPAKKTGWIHIYPNMICSGTVHHTRQEAEKSASNGCIAILEITWEE